MSAFQIRGEELSKLSKAFTDRLCASFELFLQRKIKHWSLQSARQKSQMASNSGSNHKQKKAESSAAALRDSSESSYSSSRIFENENDVDWLLSNTEFHKSLKEYQGMISHLNSLDPRVIVALRQIYIKNVSQIYRPHFKSLFRVLKERLPKPGNSKHHFAKVPQLSSWSFHLTTTQLSEALGASAILQQALNHVCLPVRFLFFYSDLFI